MKLDYKITTAVAAIALGAFATQSLADAFADKIVADLQSEGYRVIEVELGPNQVKAEAIKGETKVELVYDRTTSAELSREEETADAEDMTGTGIEYEQSTSDFVDAQGREIDSDGDDDDGDDDDADDKADAATDSDDDDDTDETDETDDDS